MAGDAPCSVVVLDEMQPDGLVQGEGFTQLRGGQDRLRLAHVGVEYRDTRTEDCLE